MPRTGLVIYSFLFAVLIFSSFQPVMAQRSFTARSIGKNLAKVNDSLYAGCYEVSNGEYKIFLKDVSKKDSALYWSYRSDSTQWNEALRYCEPLTSLRYHSHPAFADYPVVNISYAAAIAYCQWLTEIYNNDGKRKFHKVVFALPDKKEWTTASKGNHPEWMYPWGNYYMVNKRGYFMCNFKPVGDPYYVGDSAGKPKIVNYNGSVSLHAAYFPEEKTFYTMKVKSFYPNSIGIYNTSGNVAEMIATAGYAMGGSWNSYGGEITPKSIKQYKCPSPEVGFRVFMKVVEQ